MEPQKCDACGKAKHQGKDLLKCGRCRQVFYHDKVCQKNHWSKHKTICRKLVLQKQEEEEQRLDVEIVQTKDKGRALVALKDFAPGDRVFLESPAILFDTQLEYFGLLEAFGSATQETQSKVLDLHAPPLSQIDLAARQRRHARLEQQRQAYLHQYPEQATALTVDISQKLLVIIETNAHQLFNADLEGSGNNGNVDANRWMGLFLLGSMPEHSCNPNMTMNTTRDGKLELITETHVPKGERLSFSYIEGVYEKSRDQRQAQLLAEKHFECQCSRCQDVDECRPILLHTTGTTEVYNCELCGTSHPLFWHAGTNQYICITKTTPNNIEKMEPDNAELQTFLRVETELSQQLHQLEQSLQNGESPIDDVLPRLAAVLTGSQWQTTIHPFHWLQVSAHHFLSTTSAAIARIHQQQQQVSPRTSSLLRLSVLALLHNIVWLEETIRILRSQASTESSSNLALHYAMATTKEENNTLVIVKRALTVSLANTNGSSFTVQESELASIIKLICETTSTSLDEDQITTADTLLTAFYAGQDLIIAGHVDLCLLLYQRYQHWFHKLKQPSDDNRARIDLFLSSQGRTIPFGAERL